MEDNITGPLASLDMNKYKSASKLTYPLDIDTQYKHYLKININIPERSGYKPRLAAGSGSSSVNSNRTNFASSLISASADPYGALAAITGTAAAAVGGGAVQRAIGALAKGKSGLAAAAGGLLSASIVGPALSFVDLTRKTSRLAQEIYLYVPDTVQQRNLNKWSGVSVTAALGLAGFAADAAVAGGDAITKAVEDALSSENPKLSTNPGQEGGRGAGFVAEGLGRAAAASGAFGEGMDRIMMASVGLAQNPQIEILFDSPDNREFQFDFKFTPKNRKEAEQVLNIIKALRFHAAPELVEGAGGGRFFVPPSEFEIGYYFNGEPNKALHKFSTCVLTGIDVNYTSGAFASYEDGVPVEIAMQLQFMEVEIIHKRLIEEGF